jgi:hypothetical protein
MLQEIVLLMYLLPPVIATIEGMNPIVPFQLAFAP